MRHAGRRAGTRYRRGMPTPPASLPLVLPVDAVVFDCDGVLVDSLVGVDRSWTRWALEYDLDPETVLAHIHGKPSRETSAWSKRDMARLKGMIKSGMEVAAMAERACRFAQEHLSFKATTKALVAWAANPTFAPDLGFKPGERKLQPLAS